MGVTELSIVDREHGSDDSLPREKGNTSRDESEMSRMGKKQELRVGISSPVYPMLAR